MCRYYRVILSVLLGLLLLVVPATSALASNPTVTITVSVWIVGYPGGFTLTYISDYEVEIDWEKGLDAENTMIRAAIGRMPESREDGIEIYYGPGTSATSWINMETLSAPVYYHAWSENAEGMWEEEGASGFIEGITMLTIGLIVLALGITGIAVWRKQLLLYMVAAIGCLIIAVHLTGTSLVFGIPIYLMSGYMFWEFVTWWF